MKRLFIIYSIALFSLVWANRTRMNNLMVGDYIDDPVNIGVYPQHINVFSNNFYGDILSPVKTNFGLVITPVEKYGGIYLSQDENFTIGYGITLKKIEIGIMGSPVKDQNRLGAGIGYVTMDTRADFSAIFNNELNKNEGYELHIRVLKRKTEYILIPRYSLVFRKDPNGYHSHNMGLALQRLILNDGFVILGMEYLLREGAISSDRVYCFMGLELALNRTFYLKIGAREEFDEDFVPVKWSVEPGLGLRIKEFNLDFHLNQERLFNKETTFFKSFGLDLNFGRF
ncbi:MAG: hypothetical protein N3A65_04400 [candidate division WOR-3 bacterium]|nr:hypothetical protein [candidate division WOR-3 bacterium]